MRFFRLKPVADDLCREVQLSPFDETAENRYHRRSGYRR
jgi:hypothetical protein